MAEHKRSGAPMDEKTQDMARKTGEMTTGLKDKAKDVASTAANLASQAKEQAKDWAGSAAEKADDARSAVGSGMESLAGKIRRSGPQEGMMGTATAAVADQLESAGSYLQEHGFSEMGRDLTQTMTRTVRRYPIQSVLVGLGIGFLLARATRR